VRAWPSISHEESSPIGPLSGVQRPQQFLDERDSADGINRASVELVHLCARAAGDAAAGVHGETASKRSGLKPRSK